MSEPLRVAVAGNPNTGKTTLFNALTGARQRVANYPGVTVATKVGRCAHAGRELIVTDLPGTYDLSPRSEEERVARDAILRERPDVLVVVLDASNLERSLFLGAQLMERDLPLVFALNMIDVAESRGLAIDVEGLAQRLGAPAVPTVATRERGLDRLLDAVVAVAGPPRAAPAPPPYGPDIEPEIARVEAALRAGGAAPYPGATMRWTAARLIEGDAEVRARVQAPDARAAADQSAARLRVRFGEEPVIALSDWIYGWIAGLVREVVRRPDRSRRTRSDAADEVLTHPLFGLPIFLAMMYLTFQIVFLLGRPATALIEAGFSGLGALIAGAWPEAAAPLARSLVIDGVVGGVGGVLVFLPNILLLYLAVAALEDSGYMARAAFVVDHLMHRIGLHGKSFLPMLLGFGCSVPAILATRTLEHRRDRLTTMFVIPLVSCGARLTIYALVIPAFFPPRWQAPVLMAVYLLGILLAIGLAKALRVFVFRGESVPMVMELPPYRRPTAKGLTIYMWQQAAHYLRKAATIILGVSILMWALATFPWPAAPAGPAEARPASVAAPAAPPAAGRLEQSYAGRIGRWMEPALRPLGFDWRIGTALIGALAAKEVFVAQLGVVFAVDEGDESRATLRARLRDAYKPLTGFCVLLFCLIAAPCAATLAAVKQESGSWGWALAQAVGLTALGYALTLAVYQLGRWLGFG